MTQLTPQQIEAQSDAAIADRAAIDAVEPRAEKVFFNDGRITLLFNNSATFSFFPESVEAIATLSKETIATVKLTPSGKGLRWNLTLM